MRPRKQTFEERAAELKARLNGDPAKVIGIDESPLTVQEAATRWGMSVWKTRDHFKKVPGVRVITSPTKRGKRKYDTVLIPPSVLDREIARVTVKAA